MIEFDQNGFLLAEYQAKIFEKSYDLECSSPIFLRRFMHSKIASKMDEGSSASFSLDPVEGIKLINEEYGETKYGEKKISKEALFWMGYIYRYISYTRNESTLFVMNTFDYKLMNDLYFSFHTQSPEWVIRSLLEIKGLDENYLDKNERLKKIMRERYIKRGSKKIQNSKN